MLRLTLSALAVFAFASVASAVCPYTMVLAKYGTACSPVSLSPPTLTGNVDGTNTCAFGIQLNAPPLCCNVFLNGEWLFVGTQQLNLPAPGGCTLLASPDFVITLPPMVGTTKLGADLPPDPALVGTTIFLQGITSRFTTIGLSTDFEFSNGLALKIAP